MANKRFNGQYNNALKRIPLISEAIPKPKGATKGATAGVQKASRDSQAELGRRVGVPNLNGKLASDAPVPDLVRRAGRDALNGVTTGGAYKALKEKYAKNQSPTRGSVKPRTKSTK